MSCRPGDRRFAEGEEKRTRTGSFCLGVRLPRSVHAALLAEAKVEGVSLNQPCLSKLVAQLRAVINRPQGASGD